jgi:hypothetical protein
VKIAFSVTGPDLARALAEIARQAAGAGERRGGRASTVSPEARRALVEEREADDERS